MDRISRERRSANMAAIRAKDTQPELTVRRLAHRLGYRFRLHRAALPGKPDIVFPGSRKVIFVHGCFWHQHDGCRFAYAPKTRRDWWQAKFVATKKRDARNIAALQTAGWDSLVVWECQTLDHERLKESVARFLGGKGAVS